MPQKHKSPPADVPALARLGKIVRSRLDADPVAFKIPTDKLEIYGVASFMMPDECAHMMKIIDGTAKPSTLFDSPYESGFRTSYSGNVDTHDPFVKMIERRIDDLLGLPAQNGETIQGQRYKVGQEFKAHQDYFHTSQGYWEKVKKDGGQRSWTAMVYLNPVDEGGSTDFPNVPLSVPPQPGTLLAWNNMKPDGTPNRDTLHAGTPVIAGTKYIITKWYRAGRWR